MSVVRLFFQQQIYIIDEQKMQMRRERPRGKYFQKYADVHYHPMKIRRGKWWIELVDLDRSALRFGTHSALVYTGQRKEPLEARALSSRRPTLLNCIVFSSLQDSPPVTLVITIFVFFR
jgi:hypothetical protein